MYVGSSVSDVKRKDGAWRCGNNMFTLSGVGARPQLHV